MPEIVRRIIENFLRDRMRKYLSQISVKFHNIARLIENEFERIYKAKLDRRTTLMLVSKLMKEILEEKWRYTRELRERIESRIGRKYTRRDLERFFHILLKKYEGIRDEIQMIDHYREMTRKIMQEYKNVEKYSKEMTKAVNKLIEFSFKKIRASDALEWLYRNIESSIVRDFIMSLYTRFRRETKSFICFDANNRDLFELVKGLRPYAIVKVYARIYGDVTYAFGSDFDCQKEAIDKKIIEYARIRDLDYEELKEIIEEAKSEIEGTIDSVEICIDVIDVAGRE